MLHCCGFDFFLGYGGEGLDGDFGRLLYYRHHKVALEAANAGNCSEGVEHKGFVVLHVAHIDFEHIIEVARDVVALGNLGNRVYGSHKLATKRAIVLL